MMHRLAEISTLAAMLVLFVGGTQAADTPVAANGPQNALSKQDSPFAAKPGSSAVESEKAIPHPKKSADEDGQVEAIENPSRQLAVASVSQTSASRLRDPFWPIGWEPPIVEDVPAETRPISAVRWNDVLKRLDVTALSKKPDGSHVAIIKNIGVVEIGDVVTIRLDGLTYHIEIHDITPAGVVPKRLSVGRQ